MQLRTATKDDLQNLVALRMQLFVDVGEIESVHTVPLLQEATKQFFISSFSNAKSCTWVAEVQDEIVACGTLVEFMRPPYLGNSQGREGYLLNMYTVPSYRRQGYAKAILTTALSFAKREGYGKVWLHSSEAGRALYEHHGFHTNLSALEWLPS